MNDTSTVHVRLVFPTPSTNVCSNMMPLFFSSRRVPTPPRGPLPLLHGPNGSFARRLLGGARSGRRHHCCRFLPFVEPIVPEQHDRTRDKYRRVRSDDNTYHQSK